MYTHTQRSYVKPQKRRRKRKLYRRLQTFAARILTLGVIVCSGIGIYGFVKKDPEAVAGNNGLTGLSPVSYKAPVKELGPVTSLYHSAEIVDGIEALLHQNPCNEMEKIAYNIDAYPGEILALLLRNQETLSFVADYPENITKSYDPNGISVAGDYISGEMPLFLQWDERWGYGAYGMGNMALNGCGPTSLSMVLVALTGDTSLNPLAVARYSEEMGMITETNASTWDLFTTGAAHFGLRSKEVSRHGESILSTLRDGKPIIVSVDEGDFTTGGHILVLRGVDNQGRILVNDPNSPANSQKAWDLDVFLEQAKNFWTYEIA